MAHMMAYIALPTRDSSFLLLSNAAPRLPRSASVTTSSSLVDGAAVRPMRVHASRLFGAHLSSNFHPRGRKVFAAVEGSVTVEEPAVSTASEESEEESALAEAVAGPAGESTEPSDAPAKQLQRSNTVRRQAAGAKREIIVTTEQLVAGAVFTGKVRAVQSYGAFVDIGAFTDGLVHISQLSSGYVKEVSDVVTVGQEVSVTVVELNEKSGRIALSMRDKESEAEQEALRVGGESGVQGDVSGKPMNRGKIAGRGGGTARSSSRSNDDKKATKLKKGQELKGTVKNIIRNGAFIAFAEEGEEGFLRGSEITEGGENMAVDSLLTVGQEVTVRVLKIERGKAALTMKPQVDMTSINDSLNMNVGAGGASNPFATFFRSANLVPAAAPAASVDAEEAAAPPAVEEETPGASVDAQIDAAGPAVEETPAVEEVSQTEDSPVPAVAETPAASVDAQVEAGEPSVDAETSVPAVEETSAVLETPAVEEISQTEDSPVPTVAETPAASVDAQVEAGGPSVDAETSVPAVEETSAVLETPAVEEVSQTVDTPPPAVSETPVVEETSSPEAAQSEEAPAAAEESADDSSKAEEPHSLSLGEIAEGIGGAVAEVEKVVETAADLLNVGDKDDGGASEATGAPSSEETESRAEEAQPVEPASGPAPVAASPEPEIVPEPAASTAVLDESRAEAAPVVEEPQAEGAAPVPEEAKAAAVPSGPSAAQVKELREKSGAGMMECKKALVACGNDVSKASEYLRKKGLAGAEKKSSRIAAEGRVGSYVHDGRMGVLIELNCETDFVSRGTQFKELVSDMGMQVVACPDVRYVSVDDVPAEFVQKEREIEMGKEDLSSKPPQIREKIVEGRIAKRLAELALLEQAYIRDDKVPVKDLVKETTAKLGEKVQIRRFVRFNLGEGLQKKSSDFAAEVAAQTAAQADVKPAGEAPPKVEEAKKEEDAPKVAVSAGTVKELRDATGAGMMDCKKALSACENDVSKATDYLRKKGLASADKKSGRVASEGLIGSYIHDGRIGVLVEVNSETDFVARSAQFKELVANIGMQVAACPQVQYVSVAEIPASFVEKEKEIEMGKEDLGKRPEAVRGKIVEGRVAKTLNELALLEQPYIRDDKLLVKDYVKQTVAALGENIQVRRFARFNLGEGLEKRSTDFAAEVAAQTGSKA